MNTVAFKPAIYNFATQSFKNFDLVIVSNRSKEGFSRLRRKSWLCLQVGSSWSAINLCFLSDTVKQEIQMQNKVSTREGQH